MSVEIVVNGTPPPVKNLNQNKTILMGEDKVYNVPNLNPQLTSE